MTGTTPPPAAACACCLRHDNIPATGPTTLCSYCRDTCAAARGAAVPVTGPGPAPRDILGNMVPLRIQYVKGEPVPLNPENCEPHTQSPSNYLAWDDDWAERMGKTHVQRQCKGCGLWAIWEPKGASR